MLTCNPLVLGVVSGVLSDGRLFVLGGRSSSGGVGRGSKIGRTIVVLFRHLVILFLNINFYLAFKLLKHQPFRNFLQHCKGDDIKTQEHQYTGLDLFRVMTSKHLSKCLYPDH